MMLAVMNVNRCAIVVQIYLVLVQCNDVLNWRHLSQGFPLFTLHVRDAKPARGIALRQKNAIKTVELDNY